MDNFRVSFLPISQKNEPNAASMKAIDSFSSPENREVTFEKIKLRDEQYDLPILFAYDSYSLGNRKKFNVVFLNETPFSDLREAEAMQSALMMIFPEADKDCSVLKVNKGGNKLLYSDKAIPTINAEWLLMNMCLRLKDQFGSTNYKRKIAEYSRKTDVMLDDRSLPCISTIAFHTEHLRDEINDKNLSKCIIDKGSNKILSKMKYEINFNGECVHKEVSLEQDGSSSSDPRSSELLKSLGTCCRLYHEFESGNKGLTQQELLGIASNLSQVKSGQKVFKDILGKKIYWNNQKKIDNWDYYLYYIRGKGARPCSCFCPYRDICQHGSDILATAKPKPHQIERLANSGESLVELDEAWEDFSEKFLDAVTSSEPGWYVIKSQTALGKTQAILEFLRDTSFKVLIVVPTNKLKREVVERAKKMGIYIIASPSLHELQDEIPDVVWDEIQALYDAGKSPMSRLEKAIAENDVECAKLFKQYKRELEKFKNFNGHAITTHRRLTNMDVSKYDLIIVDEDIIYSTVIPNRETIPLSKLKKLRKKLAVSDPLTAKINRILKKVNDSDFLP